MRGFAGRWQGLTPHYSATPVETGVSYDTLRFITERITQTPEHVSVHPKLQKQRDARYEVIANDQPVDWALAEALAFGSLLLDGTHVRLSGQDSRRGTFSQRHAALFDARTGEPYVPLNSLRPGQARFSAYDSPLSEAAVLGFEFGHSLDSPHALVMWEAQFGDFANGAQVIIDQFIVCSETKWQRDSGLVLLLPHGYEGQGPEHSSARPERFLQMCAEDNIQVCNPTTPAQYFHVLRRQQKWNMRKPVVLLTPKSLLRHKAAVSPVDDFVRGHFVEVLEDPRADPGRVRRVLFCSGKVYYDLIARRSQDESGAIAIVRLEQLYPFPEELLSRVLSRYRHAEEWIWFQEESLNMGGLGLMSFFIKAALEALRAFPVANARIDGEDIVHHDYYHIGIAVSTERGLMVPVLQDADHMSFGQIEQRIAELAQKAREGKISVNDLEGGTSRSPTAVFSARCCRRRCSTRRKAPSLACMRFRKDLSWSRTKSLSGR